MPPQYSLKSLLRQAPNELLQRHLTGHHVALDFPWEELRETSIQPIFQAIAD